MAFPTTPLLDQFSRTENPLSDNGRWTGAVLVTGSETNVSPATDGNSLVEGDTSGANGSSAYRNDQNYGPDCEAYATVVTVPDFNSGDILFFVRLQGSGLGSGTPNGYIGEWRIRNHSVQNDTLRIVRLDNGVRTTLASQAGPNAVNGDVLGVGMVGSTLTMYQNGTSIFSFSDSTYPQAGKIGIYLQGTNAGNPLVDDFGGGTTVFYGDSWALKPLWKPKSYQAIFRYLQNIGEISGASTLADTSASQFQIQWAYDTKYEKSVRNFFLNSLQGQGESASAPPTVPDVPVWTPRFVKRPPMSLKFPGLYMQTAQDTSAAVEASTPPSYTPRPLTRSSVPRAVFFYIYTHTDTSQSAPTAAQTVGRVTGLEHRPRHWPGIIR